MYDSDELRALAEGALKAESGSSASKLRQAMTPKTVLELLDEIERLRDALDKISHWSKAYPLDIFPAPDWIKSARVLKEAGLSLDAISAANMRHVITRVMGIVDAAMAQGGDA